MSKTIKVSVFKDGKIMHEDRIGYANGEYVSYKDHRELVDEISAKNKQLQCELDKIYNQLMETEKETQDKIAELETELEVKDNLLKIKNGLCGNNDELPVVPIEVAQMLIDAKYEYKAGQLEKALLKCGDTRIIDRYSIDDLEQIAEHLLVYCKHNRGNDE